MQATIMSASLAVVLLLCRFHHAGVAAYTLTMSPEYVRTSSYPENVSFTCTADTALTACQFQWGERGDYTGPLLDLSRGSLSQANSTHLNRGLTGYSYVGRGLSAGDCGVSLQVEGLKGKMMACRVRAETGGWTYAWSDFTAANWPHLPNTLTPRDSVVLPGGEARFTMKADLPLTWCRFFVSALELDFDDGAQSNQSTGRHRYLGAGVESGECGLALSDVGEADNGPVWSYMGRRETDHPLGMFEYRYMTLVVAHPPDPPTLSVVYTDAGVTATCEVRGSRPVADISWILGDDVVRQDSLDESPVSAQDEWRWPWMWGSVLQRLTLGRKAEDNGKVLKCVVSHVTLAHPLEATDHLFYRSRMTSSY